MPKRIDLVGQKFGRLTVISFSHGGKHAVWNCLCVCGKETKANSSTLKRHTTRSCGCLRDELRKTLNMDSRRALAIAKIKARAAAKHASPDYIQAQKLLKRRRELRFHGMSRHPLYTCWRNMKRRCYEPERKDYKNYGARGIKVCDRWMIFKNFYDDVIAEYKEGLTIDRIDVNGDYEPNNIRWATWKEQANNRVSKRH